MDRGVHRRGGGRERALNALEIVQVYEEDGFVRVRVTSMPEDPADLGRVLMDAATICAEVYRRNEGATNSDEYLERIIEGIQSEIDAPTGQVEDIREVKKN